MAQVTPLSEFYKTVNPENAYVREQLRVYRALGQRSTDAVGWIALKLRLSRAKAEALITRATPPPRRPRLTSIEIKVILGALHAHLADDVSTGDLCWNRREEAAAHRIITKLTPLIT